ncbi:hypothetical protein [Gordonia alkanivorans]|uniref:hypothetical protein n=1 Tax=Gordonia alkanivorans TaxID=84096 RepID=UPI001F4E4305|nr:hypothetical protein [Gordonia alkanivorans]
MKLDYDLHAASKKLPLVAAAPIRLTMTSPEADVPGYSYDPSTQETIGTAASSYCNINESIGVPFNSTADSKQDD